MQSLTERFTCRILVYHQCEALNLVEIRIGCFYKGNYLHDFFFSGGSGAFIELNSGGGGWIIFFYWSGGCLKQVTSPPPSQVYLNGTALKEQGWDHVNWFKPVTFLCACPKPGSRFPSTYVVFQFVFSHLRSVVVVGWIYFLFIIRLYQILFV